jgi:hypothetical protein
VVSVSDALPPLNVAGRPKLLPSTTSCTVPVADEGRTLAVAVIVCPMATEDELSDRVVLLGLVAP